MLPEVTPMNDQQKFLDQIQIASPCSANWDEMKGNERTRACDLCQKNVYNLSAMTRDEAVALIKEKEGSLCVKLYRRYDGTLLTSDCPVGIKERARWLWWKVTTVAAAVIASVTLTGCGSKSDRPIQGSTPAMLGGVNPRQMMGEMVCPPKKETKD